MDMEKLVSLCKRRGFLFQSQHPRARPGCLQAPADPYQGGQQAPRQRLDALTQGDERKRAPANQDQPDRRRMGAQPDEIQRPVPLACGGIASANGIHWPISSSH